MNVRCSVTAALAVLVLMFFPSSSIGLDLFDIEPGSERSEVEGLLREAGFRHRPSTTSRIEVRGTLLEGVFELQRCFFDFGTDGRLNTATVEVTPALNSDGFDVLELYEEVTSMLLRRLGSPVRERSTGSLRSSGQILVGFSTGEVERMMEWESPHPVRAGIPRRVDGRILVVVVFSRHALPENDPFWGAGDP